MICIEIVNGEYPQRRVLEKFDLSVLLERRNILGMTDVAKVGKTRVGQFYRSSSGSHVVQYLSSSSRWGQEPPFQDTSLKNFLFLV